MTISASTDETTNGLQAPQRRLLGDDNNYYGDDKYKPDVDIYNYGHDDNDNKKKDKKYDNDDHYSE
eukprot:CAMPEP_0201563716 /NCGR_PEP_ID=MMETSP0190_2-20130828/962_1 /ASSEMBLY_ACC=CAM_ASM_000263 /TAXON_ID=37353 /ORGANISM="Rosalina sp." /LENGTH=65 /DNA_ID=CAMNT_0047978855 /DNA_START=76 /DNA_END=270 /DNA_ORIENTATION=+